MGSFAQIQKRLAALESNRPSDDNRVTHIICEIINPDGSHHKTLIREIGKPGYREADA